MAYTETILVEIPQPAPEVAYLVRLGQPILFSEIFNGVPQLYIGSSFEVEEIYEVSLEVTDLTLIDTDFRWVPAKRYLGTWRISDTFPTEGMNSEDEGFINNEKIKIKRYSTYVVQANADVPIAEFESGVIDNCNFQLRQQGVVIPPTVGLLGKLNINDAVFKFRNTLQKVPLIDREFVPKIRFIGIYVNPGCQIIAANYTARIINGISVDLPAFPPTVCTVVTGISCEVQFQNEFDNVNDAPGYSAHVTEADGLSQIALEGLTGNQFQFGPATFACPTPPFTTVTYWVLFRTGLVGGD